MHLDDRTLDAYLARSLDGAALRAIDDHVASCLTCLLTVEQTGLESARWERRGLLGRLVKVTPRVAAVEELRHAA